MIVTGETIGESLTSRLHLRVDDADFEASKGATTHDPKVMVPWPLSPSVLIDFYLGSPWLGAIGNLLADAVASASWELQPREADLDGSLIDRGSDFRKEQDGDYARANAWLSRETVGREGVSELDLAGLLRAMTSAADQTGNVFVEIIRDRAGQAPTQVGHLLPQYVRYWARDGQLELYQMDPLRGEFSFVPFGARPAGEKEQREYLHQRQPNTVSSYYGVPTWIVSRESVEVDNEHRKYLKGFFKRHTTPRYMIHVTQDPEWTGGAIDETQADQVMAHIRSFLSANAGDMAGRNLLIRYPGGILVKAEPLDVKLEDPTFPNTSKAMRDEILAVRHVSLIDLGLPEGGYRATAAEQSDNFRTQVLAPFAAPAVQTINKVLHAPAPSGLGVETYDFALKFERVDDTLKRIEGIVKAVGGPVLSQVEGRQLLDYEAKGSDDVFMPMNMVPGLMDFGGGPDGGDEPA